MQLIIFSDNDGSARSIRGNCIQPCMGGGYAKKLDHAQSNAIYTAVIYVYEL